MNERPDPAQSLQRIKVGMIGLAAVILLIALASVIIRSATRERPLAGTAQTNAVVETLPANADAVATEPLADLGVAPGSGNAAEGAATR